MIIPSKFFSYQFLSCFGTSVSSCTLLYKKSLAFDINQSPSERSPEDHQVHAHAYLSSNKVQSCFMHPFSILVCSMFECVSGNSFVGILN